MEKGEPPLPSPVSSNHNGNGDPGIIDDAVLQNGFQQLIQHNSAPTPTSYPTDQPLQLAVDVGGSHIGSNPHSRYSSPAPMYDPRLSGTPTNHGSPYAAPSYSSGGCQQDGYSLEPSPYPQLPDVTSTTPHNAYSTPATSPPTPLQNDGMTTRSGRVTITHNSSNVLGPQHSSRVEKSSASPRPPAKAKKQRKKKANANGKSEVVLEAPLSELVRGITHITDTDIEAYVHRTPETRRQEVATSKDGKIKRPMNAFMLYRKAHQNRAKEWKRHDNHQIISQLCGVSWNMEHQELKDHFDELAKIERAQHKLAFPDYKFAPAKARKAVPKVADNVGGSGGGRRTGGAGRDSEEEGSDLEGYDWAEVGSSAPPSRSASRGARAGSSSLYGDPDGDYRPPRGLTYYTQHQGHPPPRGISYGAHQSSFQYSNPGKPRPAEYGAGLGSNQYYQQSSDFRPTYPHHPGMHPHHHMGGAGGGYGMPSFVENVYISKANSPGAMSYHPQGSPVDHYGDLMGSAYPPLPQQHSHHSPPLHHHHRHPQAPMSVLHTHPHHPHHDHPIDPSLMQATTGGGGSVISQESYDALGILGLDPQSTTNDFGVGTATENGGMGGGLSQYEQDLMGTSSSAAHHPHSQQFEQAYHHPTPEDNSLGSPWQPGGDENLTTGVGGGAASLSGPLDGAWEILGESDDFRLGDMDTIDEILGTTDSPGA